jgi:hypothetical protein
MLTRNMLVETCNVCKGSRWVTGDFFHPVTSDEFVGRHCNVCDGKGEVPTELGNVLLDFLSDFMPDRS